MPTPRVAVVPPTGKTLITGPRSDKSRPLKEAVYLSTAEGDHTLFSERVLIGRAPHCRVIVLDPLVSREHALIRIAPNEVFLEDLRSANGVYVNNVRIFEPQQLFEGDRVLVGTHEMCVFSVDGNSRPREAVSRPVPPKPTPIPGMVPKLGASTERADALQVLGRLADRLFEQGVPAEAERVLSDHLKKLIDGARSGLPVPPHICASASHYSLLLAERLHNGKWVNYAIELHLRAEQLLSPQTLEAVERALKGSRNVDPVLFGFYVEWLRDNLPRLGPLARDILERLDRIKIPTV
jgi:hypothetical protein